MPVRFAFTHVVATIAILCGQVSGVGLAFVGAIDQSAVIAWTGTIIAVLSATTGFYWKQYSTYRENMRREHVEERRVVAEGIEHARLQLLEDREAAVRMAKSLKILELQMLQNTKTMSVLYGMHEELILRHEKCPFAAPGNEACESCEERAKAMREQRAKLVESPPAIVENPPATI